MLRRDLLLSTAAMIAVAGGAEAASHRRRAAGATKSHDSGTGAQARLNAMLDGFFEDGLRRNPESATELGLDKGARGYLKSKLGDVSQAGLERDRAANAARLAALKGLDRGGLPPQGRIAYDTVTYVEDASHRVLAFDFVAQDGFSPSPYALSPITGAYQRVPTFLDTKHTVKTADDAEAYISRLEGFASALDANTARAKAAAGQGVLPPDFLLDTTLAQLTALHVDASRAGPVISLARKAQAAKLSEGWGGRAEEAWRTKVAPALQSQVDAVRDLRGKAQHDPGIWRFKDGPAFYAANLHYTTTTEMTPEEIHKLGLDQAKEIGARLDVLLKAQGLTQGTVGERIAALYKDPKQYYPNDTAGKAQLIADLQAKLAQVKARLPRMFATVPGYRIEARAVPPAIDAGQPLAYSESPSLDGSRPGYIYFNLHDTAEWPRWNLPSTLYHEGLPGHQLQGGIALKNRDIPLFVRSLYFSGYGEGWALYAEQLADELGLYDDDPLGRIGWLKAQMFRAGRCVVDTGIHHLRWSREKAIATLMEMDGDAVGSTTREVDRYCAIPGQACSYKIGHTTWNRLRDRAKTELGAKFDIKGFHDAGLKPGAMPLDVLDRAIAEWTQMTKV